MSEGQVQEVLHSRADVVFNVTLVLAIVATVFVGLRITSKWIVVKRNNSDDVFTIIAWVGCLFWSSEDGVTDAGYRC
jgi:hypothetical protein